MTEPLAPCIAIVGPPNSGKSMLVRRLDSVLQRDPARLLIHVVKGSPDGTGHYLERSPELREGLKGQVKGRWLAKTPDHIRRWVRNARSHLDIALLDFGGRHDPANPSMLRECSHYVVLARRYDDAEQERSDGMESWASVCESCDLKPIARIRSLFGAGESGISSDGPVLSAAFRSDAGPPARHGEPEDAIWRGNEAVVRSLVERLKDLVAVPKSAPYLDLRLRRDWTPDDLPALGGLAARIVERSLNAGELVLGGRAPIWAYAAAMHLALDQGTEPLVHVFDPKLDDARLEVPINIQSGGGSETAELAVRWHEASGATFLCLDLTRQDKFVDLEALAENRAFPLPSGSPPGAMTPLVVSGAAPVWLHLSYSRWLRRNWRDRDVGHWDAGCKGAFTETASGRRRFVPCPPPGLTGAEDG